jgi:hypothetical protein
MMMGPQFSGEPISVEVPAQGEPSVALATHMPPAHVDPVAHIVVVVSHAWPTAANGVHVPGQSPPGFWQYRPDLHSPSETHASPTPRFGVIVPGQVARTVKMSGTERNRAKWHGSFTNRAWQAPT